MKGYVETNNPLHQAWIDRNVGEKCQRSCLPKADAMAKVFPELRVVGQSDPLSGHAWCVTEDDKVVDPTAHQFDKKYPYGSIRLEREDFPIDKCPYCGESRWKDTPGVRKFLKEYGYEDIEEQIHPHTICAEEYMREMNA